MRRMFSTRPVRCRVAPARIRHLSAAKPASTSWRLLNRLTMPVVTTLHTVLSNPRALRAVPGTDHRGLVKVVVMAEKGRELLQKVYGVAAGEDRGDRARHSGLRVRRAGRGKGPAGLRRPSGHPDLRAAFSEQGHRRCDRRHARDPRAGRTPSMSSSARPIRTSSAERARPIARAWWRASGARGRAPRRLPRPVRRPGDAARVHLDVRRLRHALFERDPDDVGHAGL